MAPCIYKAQATSYPEICVFFWVVGGGGHKKKNEGKVNPFAVE